MKLLDYVALYGLILMPVGAVVFTEHWIIPRMGILPDPAERKGLLVSWPAIIVWVATLALAWVLPIHLFYRWLPCWIFAIVLYALLRRWSR